MLQSLHISNYVLIQELEISLDKHFSVITGETGAGKSILLGALALLTGERAETNVLLQNDEKCIVEGVFQLPKNLKSFFSENEIDFQSETIIRREIHPSGRSRAFINDTPVNLSVLKDLSEYVIDIHSQHQSLELKNTSYQLAILDAFAENETLLTIYQKDFQLWKVKEKELVALKEKIALAQKDFDYLNFQFQELEKIDFTQINQAELEQELNTQEHAQEILQALQLSKNIISDGEINSLDQLSEVINTLNKVGKYRSDIETTKEKLEEVKISLKEITNEIETTSNQIEYTPERALEVQEQLSTLYKLFKKHQVDSTEALQILKEDIAQKINLIQVSEAHLAPLEKEIIEIKKAVLKQAQTISTARKNIIPVIEQKVMKLLSYLGMSVAVFSISLHQDEENPTNTGIDSIQFLFTANKGMPAQEIKKAISGGELSRFVLALKTVLAEKMNLPTLVFDEIDTGVSGEIAHKVGEVLQHISKKHQLLVITHLPQIAAKGKQHLFVYKEHGKTQTQTNIKILQPEERKTEIAKMLSGEKITDAALANAAELLAL